MGLCCVEFVNNTRTLNLIWALIAPNSPIIYLCPWRGLELSFSKCYVVYVSWNSCYLDQIMKN
jgi:hypothetical protein